MKIKFIGATNHITGSCSWLNYTEGKTQFLVDCGMHQGSGQDTINSQDFPFDPFDIDFMFLTHAHLDHCGLIPKLYKQGFSGKVYTTAATAKLAQIVLLDAAKISAINGLGLYTKSDVSLIEFVAIDDDPGFTWGGKPRSISAGITASFLMSSHILGAASISISWSEDPDKNDDALKKTIVFSGDIGNNIESASYLPLLKPNKYPFPETDYMLVESTYGGQVRDRKFKSSENRLADLDEILTYTIEEKKGKVIIPTFSIHRSQEIIIDLVSWLISKNTGQYSVPSDTRKIKILCHSPMIAAVCQVYFEQLTRTITTKKGETDQYLSKGFLDHVGDEDFIKNKFKFLFKTAPDDKNKEVGSKAVLGSGVIDIKATYKGGAEKYDIVLASSGMCDAGPICTYLDECENDFSNTIILTGYQSSDSRGRKLLDRGNSDVPSQVAEVKNLSGYYSGHADQDILLDYIFDLGRFAKTRHAATVFINHGEPTSKDTLKLAIEARSLENNPQQRPIKDVLIADGTSWFDLNEGQFEQQDNEEVNIQEDNIATSEVLSEMKDIKRLLRELLLTNQRLTNRLDLKEK